MTTIVSMKYIFFLFCSDRCRSEIANSNFVTRIVICCSFEVKFNQNLRLLPLLIRLWGRIAILISFMACWKTWNMSTTASKNGNPKKKGGGFLSRHAKQRQQQQASSDCTTADSVRLNVSEKYINEQDLLPNDCISPEDVLRLPKVTESKCSKNNMWPLNWCLFCML